MGAAGYYGVDSVEVTELTARIASQAVLQMHRKARCHYVSRCCAFIVCTQSPAVVLLDCQSIVKNSITRQDAHNKWLKYRFHMDCI